MDQPKSENTALVSTHVNQSCYGSLGPESRLIFFSFCLGVGIVLQFYSVWSLLQFLPNPVPFAIIFFAGVIIHLFGTTFIISVKKQLQTLTNKVRLLAVILYYTMLMLTLLSGIILKRPNITLGFTALEICAYLWYCFCWSTYSKTFVKHVQEHHQQHHHHHHYHHHHHQHSVNTQTNIQSQMP